MSIRRGLRFVLAGALAAFLVVAAGAVWISMDLRRPYRGWSGESVDVNLAPGLGAGAMLDRLSDAGVLRRAWMLRGWLSLRGGAESLHAGEYRFVQPASPFEVLERLRVGDVLLYRVTVPEGLTLDEVAATVAAAGFSSHEALMGEFEDPGAIADLDPRAADLEGYLFPDTYSFPREAGAALITRTMVRRFREVADDAYRQQVEATGLQLHDAVVLASLIERETAVTDEKTRIARVFHNRLERGMRLQCDPTVIYALKREGRDVERLTSQDLAFESPWNTYVSHGLPPGPIASPGRDSLLAAVAPSSGDELYFVAAPGGGHRFSKDLRAHQKAVAEWRAYLRSSR